MHVPARSARIGVLAGVLAAALILAFASSAFAAPSDQILPLSALKTKLDNSGPIAGYLKTVVQGSKITTIAVTIKAITGGDQASTALIMFDSTDPLIQQYGGIVAGMSGSPIYVDDGGTDKVIGALSYGDSDTLGGTGEATPIEAMLDIQHTYAPAVQELAHPIITPAGVINKIMITNSTDPLPGAAADGVAIAHPLATNAFVRGISPNSRLYKRFAARMAAHNVTVTDLSRGVATSPDVGSETFSTPFVPGSSIAALISRGDLAYGGIGTVTYTDSDTVLAYGHPEDQSGAADLYMNNAWIDGIWPSSYWPYKVGRIGALRGTITQDRSAGIMGVTDQFTAETTITAHATNADTGESTSSVVYVPRSLLNTINTGEEDYLATELPPVAASLAGEFLFDQDHTPGSAQTTTTVVVRDTDHNKLYTVTIPNFIDDSYDIPSAIVWDADDALESFESLLADDVYHYEIISVDVTSRISTHEKTAEIVGVQLPAAPHTGANRVVVSFLVHGVEATQTLNTTLTIPAGTPLQGSVSAMASGAGIGQFPGTGISVSNGITTVIGNSLFTSASRESVADVVDDLSSNLPGNYIMVRFTPAPIYVPDYGDDEFNFTASTSSLTSVIATTPTPWVTDGNATALQPTLQIHLMQSVMDYQGFNDLSGMFQGSPKTDTIHLFATPAGSATESEVGTTAPDPDDGSFDFPIENLTVNTFLRAHVDQTTDGYSAGDATVTVFVRPSIHFSASSSAVKAGRSITLGVAIYPAANAGAKVVFEAYSKKAWRKIATKTLSGGASAHASTGWKVPKGSTKVRVRFLGSGYNASATSGFKTIKGK